MRAINIANTKSRNAAVGFDSKPQKSDVRMVLSDGSDYKNIRLLKNTVATGLHALQKETGLEDISQLLIDGDPEVDMERTGMYLTGAKKIYIDVDDKPAFRVTRSEVVHSADGKETSRSVSIPEANINVEIPVRETGKLIPKDKAVRMFVFTRNYQLKHINGLTYDFLYEMAKTLHESNSLMLLGTGETGKNPLVMANGGIPYRAFLEGRIDGDKYCLLLHLTNLELKSLPKDE